MPKPLVSYWSKMALAAVGDELPRLHAQVLDEAAGIVAQTAGWFMHVVEIEPGGDHILYCRGHEGGEAWGVIVQLGEFQELTAGPGEEPLPKIEGMVPSMPMPIEAEDNEAMIQLDA